MYKIYHNDKVIRLAHYGMIPLHQSLDPSTLVVRYPGKTKHLLSLLDKLEKSPDLRELTIISMDLGQLWEDFQSVCKVIKASGGCVLNENREVLMIFRRGSWDLPKGKIDPGETKKQAAIREVQEETGVNGLQLIQKLTTSYHIYRTKQSDKRVLKPSFWYVMTAQNQSLSPQLEEDIESARWMKLHEVDGLAPMYGTIRSVLNDLQLLLAR
ncbi:MAG: NUDIX domain-containing protein [Bacteroidota bacterium]